MGKLELYGIALLVLLATVVGAYYLGKHDQSIEDRAEIKAESAAHAAELKAQREQLQADAKVENAALLDRLGPLTRAVNALRDPKGKPIVTPVFDPNCKPAPAPVVETANAERR